MVNAANEAFNIKIPDGDSVTSTTSAKSFQNIVPPAGISKVLENAEEQNTNGSNLSVNMPVCVSAGVQTVHECESGFNKCVTDNNGNLSTSRVSAETQTDSCLPVSSNGTDSIVSQSNSSRLLPEKQTWLERRAMNLYREERRERERLQVALVKEKERSMFTKSLLLPSNMYLNEEEVILEAEFNAVEPSGTFGTCKLGTYRGMTVAVKYFLPKGFPEKRLQKLILKEANVLQNLLCHKGIPKLIGVIFSSEKQCLVTSYHGINKSSTTVSCVLRNLKTFSITKDDWFIFFKSLISALIHIHQCGYIHDDLKVNNVIMEKNCEAVVIDFGKSVLITKAQLIKMSLSEQQDYRQKFPWVAPEVVAGKHIPSHASDIYSLGYLMSRVRKHSQLKSVRFDQAIDGCMAADHTKRFTLVRTYDLLNNYLVC